MAERCQTTRLYGDFQKHLDFTWHPVLMILLLSYLAREFILAETVLEFILTTAILLQTMANGAKRRGCLKICMTLTDTKQRLPLLSVILGAVPLVADCQLNALIRAG